MPEAIERAPSKFNLPVDLTQELARRVPSGQRSRFVAKAIEQALQEDARTRVLALIDNPPLHDTGGQDSVEALRALRQVRTERLAANHSPLSQ